MRRKKTQVSEQPHQQGTPASTGRRRRNEKLCDSDGRYRRCGLLSGCTSWRLSMIRRISYYGVLSGQRSLGWPIRTRFSHQRGDWWTRCGDRVPQIGTTWGRATDLQGAAEATPGAQPGRRGEVGLSPQGLRTHHCGEQGIRLSLQQQQQQRNTQEASKRSGCGVHGDDFWGAGRNTAQARSGWRQAGAADLATARLSLQAELGADSSSAIGPGGTKNSEVCASDRLVPGGCRSGTDATSAGR